MSRAYSDDAPGGADRRGALRLLSQYVVRDKPLLVRALLLLLLATAADVAGPIVLKIFIDDHLLVQRFALPPLLWLLAAYLLTQLAAAWLRYQQTLRFCDMALGAVLISANGCLPMCCACPWPSMTGP